jgi:hypothetical protein
MLNNYSSAYFNLFVTSLMLLNTVCSFNDYIYEPLFFIKSNPKDWSIINFNSSIGWSKLEKIFSMRVYEIILLFSSIGIIISFPFGFIVGFYFLFYEIFAKTITIVNKTKVYKA